MYTTANATREFALMAAAAAERVMKRNACCKSQFKFKCFSCESSSTAGTRSRAVTDHWDDFRYRGADNQNGLTMAETTFIRRTLNQHVGSHRLCPCYWDSLPQPATSILVLLSAHLHGLGCRFTAVGGWVGNDENWELMGVPYFCMVKGYPEEKFMRDRIIRAVTRFQALWRGYIHCPPSGKAIVAINETKRAICLSHHFALKMHGNAMNSSTRILLEHTWKF